MPYEYSNPKLASDTWSLPNVEVFSAPSWEVTCNRCGRDADVNYTNACVECSREATILDDSDSVNERAQHDAWAMRTGAVAFWWWTCLPGCMPDSDAFGPFETYDAALADAREQYDDGLDDDDESEDA